MKREKPTEKIKIDWEVDKENKQLVLLATLEYDGFFWIGSKTISYGTLLKNMDIHSVETREEYEQRKDS
jgi:hypothetical protein